MDVNSGYRTTQPESDVWNSMKRLWLIVLLSVCLGVYIPGLLQSVSQPVSQCVWSQMCLTCREAFLIKVMTQQSHWSFTVDLPQNKKKKRAPAVNCLTFGNAQPQLFLCEATEGCFQSLGHHLFTSWCKQGDISTLRICQSQTGNAVKSWTCQYNNSHTFVIVHDGSDRPSGNTCGCASPTPIINIEVSDRDRQYCSVITTRLDCLCIRPDPSKLFVWCEPFSTCGLFCRSDAVVKVSRRTVREREREECIRESLCRVLCLGNYMCTHLDSQGWSQHKSDSSGPLCVHKHTTLFAKTTNTKNVFHQHILGGIAAPGAHPWHHDPTLALLPCRPLTAGPLSPDQAWGQSLWGVKGWEMGWWCHWWVAKRAGGGTS